MSIETVSRPGWLASAIGYARSAEPRPPLQRRALGTDAALALVVLVAALIMANDTYRVPPAGAIAAALAASAPLALRRRFPLAAFIALVVAAIAAKYYATDISFLAVIIGAYSAAVHSRFRGAALLCVAFAGMVVAYVFWKAQAALPAPVPAGSMPLLGTVRVFAGPFRGFFVPHDARFRLDGLVTLAGLTSVAIVGTAAHAGDRIRRLQADHVAATRRALELERARIASELHDVVTHNVSVMIVQAGAARQVLDAAPGEAREALLAVESSGRAAMSELRHLLGLLSPPRSGEGPDGQDAGRAAGLQPQPGLAQLPGLVDRMLAAGLPVRLRLGELPRDLPPGPDLAAFRVVQEALTNVLKHAGKTATSVTVDCYDGNVTLDIADEGRLIPAAGPVSVPGCGRGLLGLRERVSVYGGSLDAGPRDGGGWLVRARIPVGADSPARPARLASAPAAR